MTAVPRPLATRWITLVTEVAREIMEGASVTKAADIAGIIENPMPKPRSTIIRQMVVAGVEGVIVVSQMVATTSSKSPTGTTARAPTLSVR